MSDTEQRLVQLKNLLTKALDSSDVVKVIDVLTEMQNYSPTMPQLKKTKLGITVQRLLKHSEDEVARTAKETLDMWKNQKDDQGPKKKQPTAVPIATKSTSKDTKRQKIESLFLKSLQEKKPDTAAGDLQQIAQEIEDALHRKHKENTEVYTEQFREILGSLKNSTNQLLCDRVVSRSITAERLVSMSSEELASPAQKEERKEEMKEHMLNVKTAEEQGTMSDMFTCGRCKESKVCIERQMQTRSADEPMTLYLKCMNCGKRWKE